MERKKIIVFFGIDGTGKTTLINELVKKLQEKGEIVKRVYMGVAREQKIPFMGKIMCFYSNIRRKLKKRKNPSYDVRRDTYRKRNFFWLFVYYIELWARYKSIKKLSKKSYILCDRYFYDGLVFAEGKKFSLFRMITPKPDICFLLDVPPKIIMSRKKEANEKEIKEFYRKAKIISKYFPIVRIDNTKGVGEVINKLIKEIENVKKN
jgi:thymidylate kinase